jgi:hypothetical protein
MRRKLERAISGAGISMHGADVDAVENFIELADCPQTYAGDTGGLPSVNAVEDGLEFNPYVRVSATAPTLTVRNLTDAEVDPILQFSLGATPVIKYSMGSDDDKDDPFKISQGGVLGTTDIVVIDPTWSLILIGAGICSESDSFLVADNIVIGQDASRYMGTGGNWYDTVIIGNGACYNIGSDVGGNGGVWESVIIGSGASAGLASADLEIDGTIAIGHEVLASAKGSFPYNIFIGTGAGQSIDTSGQGDGMSNAIIIGSGAVQNFTPTNNNWGEMIVIGHYALNDYVDDPIDYDSRFIAIGNEAFYDAVGGSYNIGIGEAAFYDGGSILTTTTGLRYCTGVGYYVGTNQATPTEGLTFFGYNSGNDTGEYGYNQGDVIAIGREALNIITGAGTSYFTTEKGSIYIGSYSGWDVTNVVPPATGPTGVKAAGAGLEIGKYRYRTSFVLDGKETMLGAASASNIATTAGNLIINVAAIPVYSGPRTCTARKLYRSKVGGSLYLPYYFVATIGDNSTVIYADSTPDASLTVVGDSTSYSIALGYGAKVWGAHQCVIGGDTGGYVDDIYLGNGIVNAAPLDVTINASGGVGTDIAAADLILAGGRATGNAVTGDIVFKTSTVGASGTTLQALAERARIKTLGLEIGLVTEYRYYADLANDAILTLPFSITSSARGFIAAGNNEERTDFWIDNDGDVTLMNNSANVVANADTDDKLDIGTAAAQEPLQIKNRLNATKKIFLVIWYN